MTKWNPEKYLMFKNQRTQPAIDLAKRVEDMNPASVVDIGCGPGNSTEILKSMFEDAKVLGIDSSKSMIEKAKKEYSNVDFKVCSAEDLDGKYDLMFSNACLQWIPDHEKLIPSLMDKLNANGVLAVQMPMNQQEHLFQIIKEVVLESRWNFESVHFEKNDVLNPEEYFNILSDCSSKFEIWETVYYHAMPSREHLIEWVRGTRLRPYLDMLGEHEAEEFEKEILNKLKKVYSFTKSNEIILRFRRFFFIAYK